MKSRQMGMSTIASSKVGMARAIQKLCQKEITEEINLMYFKAKALGFPDKVNFQAKVYTRVKINTPSWVGFPNVVLFHPNDNFLETLNEFSYDEYGMSNEVCSLLILMKLFYHKDWNGTDWIDMPTYDINPYEAIMDKLAKQMADQIDREILLDLYNTKSNKIEK